MTEDNEKKKRTAHKGDWKTKPMPEENETFVFNRTFSDEEIYKLSCGHIPKDMDDRWFSYMEKSTLFLHRSWTGYCVYKLYFKEDNNHLVVVNRDSEQYNCNSIEKDKKSLNRLLDCLIKI